MEKFGKRSQADDIKSILWNFWLDFAGKLSSGLEFEFFRPFVLSHLAYGVPLVPLWRWAPLRSPPPQSPSWPEGRGRSPVDPRDPDRSPSTRRRRVERLFDPGLKKSFRCIIFWKKAGRGEISGAFKAGSQRRDYCNGSLRNWVCQNDISIPLREDQIRYGLSKIWFFTPLNHVFTPKQFH